MFWLVTFENRHFKTFLPSPEDIRPISYSVSPGPSYLRSPISLGLIFLLKPSHFHRRIKIAIRSQSMFSIGLKSQYGHLQWTYNIMIMLKRLPSSFRFREDQMHRFDIVTIVIIILWLQLLFWCWLQCTTINIVVMSVMMHDNRCVVMFFSI